MSVPASSVGKHSPSGLEQGSHEQHARDRHSVGVRSPEEERDQPADCEL
jgi:hypothetical protein